MTSASGRGDSPDDLDPRRWRAFGVSLAAGFMGLLDVSIVNVAFPAIRHGLGASASEVQWVVTGYALAFGLALVAGGRLGDAWGRRRMFMIALSAFVVTSALAGLAPTAFWLVAARLAQGLAAGMLTPQNLGLVQDLFRGAERGRAMGVFGGTVAVSTAVGPVLGGLILAFFGADQGWRWIFLVNVPIGAVALVMAARLLPRHVPKKDHGTDIDVIGALLLGAAVLGVLMPVVLLPSGGSGGLWWLLVPAAGFAAVFVWWERLTVARGRTPMLNTRLFTETRGYSSGAALGMVYFCGFAGVWLVLSLFFQDGLGFTALQAGLVGTPFAIGSAVTSVVAGRLVGRWGRAVTITGLVLVMVGLVGVAVAVQVASEPMISIAVLVPLLVAGLGGGAVISPNTTMTLENVPGHLAGVAGGALQTGQRIGTAVGTAVLTTVYHVVIVASGGRPEWAMSAAMLTSTVLITAALAIAIFEARRSASVRRNQPAETALADPHPG